MELTKGLLPEIMQIILIICFKCMKWFKWCRVFFAHLFCNKDIISSWIILSFFAATAVFICYLFKKKRQENNCIYSNFSSWYLCNNDDDSQSILKWMMKSKSISFSSRELIAVSANELLVDEYFLKKAQVFLCNNKHVIILLRRGLCQLSSGKTFAKSCHPKVQFSVFYSSHEY